MLGIMGVRTVFGRCRPVIMGPKNPPPAVFPHFFRRRPSFSVPRSLRLQRVTTRNIRIANLQITILQYHGKVSNPTSDFDEIFAAQGGFEAVYKRLSALARQQLAHYGGNTRARVVLRQHDPEEIVDEAFKDLLCLESEPKDGPYYFLRNRVRNIVRSMAKNVKEGRTVRIEGSSSAKQDAYAQVSDPTDPTAADLATVVDDADFDIKVLFRLLADLKDDNEVKTLCDAIIEGYREPADLRDLTGLDQAAYEAAFKRLKRRFHQALEAIKREEKA